MKNFTLSNLKYNVPLKIWERGLDYYHNGAVTELQEVSSGNWLARVEGMELYTVEVSLNGDEVEAWDCDCPYDMGDICKHIVAVLLAIREEKENTYLNIESTTIIENEEDVSFADIMKLAKDEDIRTFIENYSLNDEYFLKNYQ